MLDGVDTDDNIENRQGSRIEKMNICRTGGDDGNNDQLKFKNPKYIFGKIFSWPKFVIN